MYFKKFYISKFIYTIIILLLAYLTLYAQIKISGRKIKK